MNKPPTNSTCLNFHSPLALTTIFSIRRVQFPYVSISKIWGASQFDLLFSPSECTFECCKSSVKLREFLLGFRIYLKYCNEEFLETTKNFLTILNINMSLLL